ncbi:hypothetical protein ACVFI8_02970 [Agarivorans sp. MS3-6]|uniref:hypothetical protein n=1 Tax=Agarivorans sp. TSD2052 TaxID=2937286 RepID=UPI00200F9518|nr:hypothetical protein [Agarivorans sp. TSD2052]UPW19995.1 hypothetical protein M0C34_06955 [Agarivorans sp. TSD2052]
MIIRRQPLIVISSSLLLITAVLIGWKVMSAPAIGETAICRAAIATHFMQRQLGQIQALPDYPHQYVSASQVGDVPKSIGCQISGQLISISEQQQALANLYFQQKRHQVAIIVPRAAAPNRVRLFTREQLTFPKVRLAKHDLATGIHEMYGEGFDTNQVIQQTVALVKANHICGQLERQQDLKLSPVPVEDSYMKQAHKLTPYLINLVQRSPLNVEEMLKTKQQIADLEQGFQKNTESLVSWLNKTESSTPIDKRLLEYHLRDLKRANPRLNIPSSCNQAYIHSAELTQTL